MKIRKTIGALLLFLLVLAFEAKGQVDTVRICCAFVNDDGSTTLTWETANVESHNLIANFTNYTIAYRPSGQNDSIVVGISPSITSGTYMDNSQDANSGSINYIVTPVFEDLIIMSGKIKTMFLEATVSPASVILQWSPMGVILGYENSYYKIYRSRLVNGQSDVLIDSVPFSNDNELLTYRDSFNTPCLDTFVYYIVLDNDLPCTSRSNKALVEIKDEEKPDKPPMRVVSTDIPTQKINIRWLPATATDTYGYVLSAGNEPRITLDTLFGANNTSYICDTCAAQTIYYFSVMSIDSCFNTSPISERHNNIVLTSQRLQCSNEIQLKWNAYNNMSNDLAKYEIYSSTDNISYSLIKSVNPDNLTTSVIINTSNPTYYFYVKAIGNINGYESTSNVSILNIANADMVDYIYIRSVSVESDNKHIRLNFFVDSTLAVPHYILQRSDDGFNFHDVITLSYSGQGSFSYIDNLPHSAGNVIYTYILLAPDACLQNYKASNIVSSMRLLAEERSSEVNNLQWNAYNGWNAVSNYEIYHSAVSSLQSPYSIGTTNMNTFIDNSANVVSDGYNITYNVIATENGFGADGKQQTVSSSYASIKKQTLCWIPNAFTPTDNQNNVFKPQISFICDGSYRMQIYNRYGQILFSTTELSQGWDGTYKGYLVPSATYIYQIKFENSEGETIIQSGVVVLID